MPNDFDTQLLDFRRDFEARQEAARARAKTLADELLPEAWRRLIGPAWKLVHALIAYRAEANDLGGGEHLFGTLADVATVAGVSERTVQRWLSPRYAGRRWLACWLSWRTWYTSRDDGFTCRGGTLFRVSLEAKACNDFTPALRPTLAALKTLWRLPEELPSGRLHRVFDDSRQVSSCDITLPAKAEGQLQPLKAEGRDVTVRASTPSFSNTRQTARVTAAGVRSSSAWTKAHAVAERLGDRHSVAYWCKQFRRAERGEGVSEGEIWRAAGLALETRAAGTLRRTPGAYAVGVLRGASA